MENDEKRCERIIFHINDSFTIVKKENIGNLESKDSIVVWFVSVHKVLRTANKKYRPCPQSFYAQENNEIGIKHTILQILKAKGLEVEAPN